MFFNYLQPFFSRITGFLIFLPLLISLGCASSQVFRVGSSGKSILIKNFRAKKLVVFVHGFKGDSLGSWNQENNGDFLFWPEALAKDPAFKRFDVLSFGYESDCSSGFNFPEIASRLSEAVDELSAAKRYESLSFVAHSLGGVVVREFILSGHEDLIRAVPVERIITLGTPNLRTSVKKMASFVCGKQDGKGANALLNSLNQRWLNRFESGGKGSWSHSAGYELVPIASLGKIVEKDSAVHLALTARGFMKNHDQIAKLNGRKDPLYLWVRRQLLNARPDSRVRNYTDGEDVRIEEVIRNLQAVAQGTDKQKILKLVDRGDLDAALAVLHERQDKKADPDKRAFDRFVKARIYELKFDRGNALANYRAAAELAPENLAYRREAAVFLLISGDEKAASRYFDHSGENGLESAESGHPSIAAHWNKLGDASRRKGDNEEAIGHYEKALHSFQKTLKPDHPALSGIRRNLGVVRYRNGEYDQAIGNWSKAAESDLKNDGADHPNMASDWNHLGSAWLAKGEFDEAIGYFERGLKSNLKNFGPNYSEVAYGRSQLGDAWRKKGSSDKAIEYYEQAEKGYLAAYGPDHPDLAVLWNNMGSALRAKGDYDQAILKYGKALALNQKTLGSDHAQVGRNWNNMGAAWSSRERYDRAIQCFEKAAAIFEKSGMTRGLERVNKNLIAARKN